MESSETQDCYDIVFEFVDDAKRCLAAIFQVSRNQFIKRLFRDMSWSLKVLEKSTNSISTGELTTGKKKGRPGQGAPRRLRQNAAGVTIGEQLDNVFSDEAERPSVVASLTRNASEVQEKVINTVFDAPSQFPASVDDEALAEGWKQVQSKDGEIYYYHKVTRVSRCKRYQILLLEQELILT